MNLSALLILTAVILFVLAAVGVEPDDVTLGWLAGGFFAAAFLTDRRAG